nr:MAG TPA: hypothetical protein [Caudoviricetes sp.]
MCNFSLDKIGEAWYNGEFGPLWALAGRPFYHKNPRLSIGKIDKKNCPFLGSFLFSPAG